MKHWTSKHINDLQQAGKIRGFKVHEKHKGHSAGKNIIRKKSQKTKAIEWLEWNLMYWSNEKALIMEKEHQFCKDRGWRFDFAWPSIKLALEYEGGIFMPRSGHNTPKTYTKDTEKYNKSAILGWRVIRVTALNYTTALKTLNELI